MAKEFLKNALNNIERYYYDEASVCERVSANICEAAKITASRMARALRGKKFFSIEDFREELLAAPFAAASFPELVIGRKPHTCAGEAIFGRRGVSG